MIEPQDQMARSFMFRKGYQLIEPRDVIKIDGIPCWYYVYDLPNDDVLELEVSWNEREQKWTALVTAFLEA